MVSFSRLTTFSGGAKTNCKDVDRNGIVYDTCWAPCFMIGLLMSKRLNFKTKLEILRLVSERISDAEIARRMGCSRQTVSRTRQAGVVKDRTTRGKILQVRISQAEAEAFEALLKQEDMTISGMLRRMIRSSIGMVDFGKAEIDALHEASNQMNALARNVVPLLQLARSGRLKWNKRDAELMRRLMDRTEIVARELQALKAAAKRGTFTKAAATGSHHG